MKLKLVTKLNPRQNVTIEIDGKMDECLRGANAMLGFKGCCDLCKNTDIILKTSMAQSYKFIDFVCTKCGAKASWGQFKEGGYFLKAWEKYEQKTEAPKATSAPDMPPEEESIPF